MTRTDKQLLISLYSILILVVNIAAWDIGSKKGKADILHQNQLKLCDALYGDITLSSQFEVKDCVKNLSPRTILEYSHYYLRGFEYETK